MLIRDPQEEFETQPLLCADLDAEPEQVISWFVRRWQMEAIFQEVHQRLGFETQRHWSETAIRRTAPALLGLFSVVALFAQRRMAKSGADAAIRRTQSLLPQTLSDLLRGFGAGAQGIVDAGGDFLQVAFSDRYGKSPEGVRETPNRGGVLCTVNG